VDSRPKLFREIEAEITIDEDEVDELDQDENDDEIQLLYPPESPQIYRRSPEIGMCLCIPTQLLLKRCADTSLSMSSPL
jgi:hypothetical protein